MKNKFLSIATAATIGLTLMSGATAQTLRDVVPTGFTMGTALNTTGFNTDQTFKDVAAAHFNSITPENAFKPVFIHPQQNNYYYDDFDAMVAWAQANGVKVKAHPLTWHGAMPQWMIDLLNTGTYAECDAMLYDHVTTLMTRYKDTIDEVDVVNEVIEPSLDPANTNILRQSPWTTCMGSDFVPKAFLYAKAAAPNVKLVFNDYNIGRTGSKHDKTLAYIKDLRDNHGIPIEKVTAQMHLDYKNPWPARIVYPAFKAFADAGFEIGISELDVKSAGTELEGWARRGLQGLLYFMATDVCLKTNGCNEVTVWNYTDKYHNNPTEAPAIMDEVYNTKSGHDDMKWLFESQSE